MLRDQSTAGLNARLVVMETHSTAGLYAKPAVTIGRSVTLKISRKLENDINMYCAFVYR
jgi:hypothetical protein